MIKPLSPSEVEKNKIVDFSPEMIKAVNNLLLKKYHNGYASFTFKEVESEYLRVAPNSSSQEAYDNHWFDFEPIFEKAGWEVDYDQPGYNETGSAVYKFSKYYHSTIDR